MRQEYDRRLGGHHVGGTGLYLLEVLIRISGNEAEEIHDNPIIIAGNLTEIRNEYLQIKSLYRYCCRNQIGICSAPSTRESNKRGIPYATVAPFPPRLGLCSKVIHLPDTASSV